MPGMKSSIIDIHQLGSKYELGGVFFLLRGWCFAYNAGVMVSRIVRFYADGFRSMTLGRTLWCIILVKLVIMFAVLRVFFFPAYLQGNEQEKGEQVSSELTERVAPLQR